MPRRLDVTDAGTRPAAIEEAAAALRSGALVAFPTETVYGLGALARDERALERLYAAKGRPRAHPLIVHLADAEAIAGWADPVPESARRLADALWPGPLTIVLVARADVSRTLTGSQPTVALRVPGHDVARALLRAVGDGLAAPSANRFGRVSPTRAEHVLDEFSADDAGPSAVAIVLDGGPCSVGLESTILDLSRGEPRLLRPGAVGIEAIERVLGHSVLEAGEAAPRVPGALPRHYAPAIPARVVPPGDLLDVPADVAAIHRRGDPVDAARSWALDDDPAGFARGLYAALRSAERSGAREVWVGDVPAGHEWAAVRDRLRRAAVAPAAEEAT